MGISSNAVALLKAQFLSEGLVKYVYKEIFVYKNTSDITRDLLTSPAKAKASFKILHCVL